MARQQAALRQPSAWPRAACGRTWLPIRADERGPGAGPYSWVSSQSRARAASSRCLFLASPSATSWRNFSNSWSKRRRPKRSAAGQRRGRRQRKPDESVAATEWRPRDRRGFGSDKIRSAEPHLLLLLLLQVIVLAGGTAFSLRIHERGKLRNRQIAPNSLRRSPRSSCRPERRCGRPWRGGE